MIKLKGIKGNHCLSKIFGKIRGIPFKYATLVWYWFIGASCSLCWLTVCLWRTRIVWSHFHQWPACAITMTVRVWLKGRNNTLDDEIYQMLKILNEAWLKNRFLENRLINDWMIERVIVWLTNQMIFMIDRFNNWLTRCFFDRLLDWLINWLTEWVIYLIISYLIHWYPTKELNKYQNDNNDYAWSSMIAFSLTHIFCYFLYFSLAFLSFKYSHQLITNSCFQK